MNEAIASGRATPAMRVRAQDGSALTRWVKTCLQRLMAVLMLTLAASCGGGAGDPGPAQQQLGSIRLALTDRHTLSCGLEHVWVTVERVRIDTRPKDGPGDRDIDLSPPRRIDLATLSGGLLQELGAGTLPPGRYRQLRLYLTPTTPGTPLANAVQASGGAPVPLDVPSAVRSGIKIPIDFVVREGQQVDLVLDFDACKSVVARGNGGYLLKPVLTAHPSTIDVQGERQVNSAGGWNATPAIAGLEGGGYVIVWTRGASLQASEAEVLAQRFDAFGSKLGDELRVDTSPGDVRYQPDVTSLEAGAFVVTWTGADQSAIYSQRFDDDGAALGPQVRVDTSGRQPWQPAVTQLAGGGWVIAWSAYLDTGEEYDIHAQRFDADGERAGAEILVNTSQAGQQLFPAVTTLADGGFVVAWAWQSQSRVHSEVHAQRFDDTGARAGPETKINIGALTAGPTGASDVAVVPAAGGGYVVAWVWTDQSEPAFKPRLYFRRVAASGIPIGDQQLAAVGTTGSPGLFGLEAAALADDGFVLTWTSLATSTDLTDIYARRFDLTGAALGPPVVVNTTLAGAQEMSDVASLDGGGYVLTWQSFRFSPDEASDIFMQRFTAAGARQ